jgi:transposase-like protein
MKERGGRIIVIPVKRRDRQTLHAAIKQWVKPFTTIQTDSWAGYNGLNTVNGYNHLVVNHFLYFVHPVTGVHTNTIEASWGAMRKVLILICASSEF